MKPSLSLHYKWKHEKSVGTRSHTQKIVETPFPRVPTPLHPWPRIAIIVETMIGTDSAKKVSKVHYQVMQFREELKSFLRHKRPRSWRIWYRRPIVFAVLSVSTSGWIYLQARRQDLAAGGPKTRRRAHFKNTVLDVCSNWGPNVKWGGRAPLAPPLAKALSTYSTGKAHLLAYIQFIKNAQFVKQCLLCKDFKTTTRGKDLFELVNENILF